MLGSAISHLVNLSKLTLVFGIWHMGDYGAVKLLKGISNLPNLHTLILDWQHCNTTVDGIRLISLELASLVNLTHLELNLSERRCGNTGTKYLAEAVSMLVKLKVLSLELN